MNNTARRTAITYPNGRVVTLGYGASGGIEEAFGLVKTVAIEGESGDKVDYARVGLGRYVKIAYPEPGVEMSMIRPGGGSEGDAGDPYDGFDRFSRVQEMRWQGTASGTPIDAWKWGYNEGSNRTWKKNLVAAGGQDEAYAYDGLSQVIRDAVGTLNTNRTAIGGIAGEEEDFTYDPTGNWLAYRKNEDGLPVLEQSRSNNKDNQLTQIDGSSQGIEYDRAGNAVKIRPGLGGDWSKHFTLVWDGWNRLVEVKDENGVTVQKNTYDGLSRRITKESGGKVVHTYWSDLWKPLEERIDSATTAATQYLWGERPGHRDELVLRDRDTNGGGNLDERLYATMDYFSGTSILDTSGTVLERYAYAAFGPRRVMGPDFTSRGASLYDWGFGFQGQFRDAETDWYNYGYRFYVSELGRWINRDPIGESGGGNLYSVSRNNGVNTADIYGLVSLSYTPPPSSTVTPFELGFEWLTGRGPRHRDFQDGDTFAEMMRSHDHIQQKIREIEEEARARCNSSSDHSDFTRSGSGWNYSLSGVQGVAKYLSDYSNLLTFGALGNLAVTFTGSYAATFEATNINCCSGMADLKITTKNSSSAASSLRPPVLGYTKWWQTHISPAINALFSTGPGSTTTQKVELTESITF